MNPAEPATTPTYAAAFRCIGPACEDTCCRTWNIPLDRQTYEKYLQFPPQGLGSTVAQHVSRSPGAAPELFAQINTTASGFCPFFEPDRLCGIQREYGAPLLSATCSGYPRTLNQVNGTLEGSLMLSCPEAARNVLLVPDSMQIAGDLFSGEFRTDNFFRLATNAPGTLHKPYTSFHLVRAWLIDMVKDRTRPLWHRLLLIGSLCKRLNDITTPEQDQIVPAILAEYRLILGASWGQAGIDNMPGHPQLKLNLILGLTEARARDPTCGARFLDDYWAFIEGIGSPAGSLPGDDIRRFQQAEALHHRPFFERAPWILENYLLNSMFQRLFPFGRQGSPQYQPRPIFDEYLLLTTQFAWLNGLLIGIAGRHAQAFADEHVVHAVQSFSREVDHDPSVPASILETLRSRGLDNLQGMAILLRNGNR